MCETEFTSILRRASDGEGRAAAELLPIVYQQLRQSAQRAMNKERTDHTLEATALVHEAYAKLVGGAPVQWANRAHFYDAAARAMQQILIDHARSRNTIKRGGGGGKADAAWGTKGGRVPLSDYAAAFTADASQVLALGEALSRMETEEPQLARVVRLRFFAGLSGEDVAQAIGVSPRKVDSLWALARAWLFRALEGE